MDLMKEGMCMSSVACLGQLFLSQCSCHVIPTWLLISSLGKYTEQSLDNSIIATLAHQHTIEAVLQKRNG